MREAMQGFVGTSAETVPNLNAQQRRAQRPRRALGAPRCPGPRSAKNRTGGREPGTLERLPARRAVDCLWRSLGEQFYTDADRQGAHPSQTFVSGNTAIGRHRDEKARAA
jgi:hypothetical protein